MKKLLLSMSLLASSMAFAADELHLYNWNNYLTEATAKRFEQSCKCKLVQDYYGDNEEMLAKLAAGAKGYDIVVPTGFAVQTLIGQKAAAPLDKAQLANLKNVNPGYMGGFFDKANAYSVPYSFTTTVLGYNETQLQKAGVLDKANSWALIFDPAVVSKIKGKVTVLAPGDSFTMPRGVPHNGINPGGETAKAVITLVVDKGAQPRQPVPAPK